MITSSNRPQSSVKSNGHNSSELTATLPASWYTDNEIYQKERKLLFSTEWLYVAHESELAHPGDYVTAEIAGYPIFITRQQDGSLTAFHNVCRHRAAPLLTETAGHLESSVVTCRYHGWSYNTCGNLLATPYFDCLSDCQRAEMSLFSIKLARFQGLVFINMDKDAADFDAKFDTLRTTIDKSAYKLNAYKYHSKVIREGNFNWKVWMDGYQECYHCMTIHPIFTRDFALQKYNVENHDHFSVHSCDRKVESSSGSSEGLWLWVYPNLGMPVYGPCFYTLQVNPLAVNKSRLTYTFHFIETAEAKLIEDFRSFVDQVTDEDINICELVQKNLEAGVYTQGVLNPNRENGVAYFHSLVRGNVLAE
jgi:choline monooxygenase